MIFKAIVFHVSIIASFLFVVRQNPVRSRSVVGAFSHSFISSCCAEPSNLCVILLFSTNYLFGVQLLSFRNYFFCLVFFSLITSPSSLNLMVSFWFDQQYVFRVLFSRWSLLIFLWSFQYRLFILFGPSSCCLSDCLQKVF